MKRVVGAVALGSIVAICSTAGSVELDLSGSGQALLVPLWATTNEHATLLTITPVKRNHNDAGSVPVVRLRLLDDEGSEAFSANIYFARTNDTWTAAIIPGINGQSTLLTSDGTCVLVESGSSTAVLPASVTLASAYGIAEMIVMGKPESEEVVTLATNGDCQGLVDRWNSGAWVSDPDEGVGPPGTEIRATVSIVNGERGTLYSIQPSALDDYSEIAQHTRPGHSVPNLATANDSGTATGQTRSRTCFDLLCLEDTWSSPLDAVAAALMAHRFHGDYSREPSLAAKTDIAFSYPVRRYYEDRDGSSSPLATTPLILGIWDRDGNPYLVSGCGGQPPPQPEFCSISQAGVSHVHSLEIVSFNDNEGQPDGEPSALLGIPHQVLLPSPGIGAIPVAGTFLAGIERIGAFVLVSNEGTRYYGAPALPVTLLQYENGTLQGPDGIQQRANYGNAFMPTRKPWPESYE